MSAVDMRRFDYALEPVLRQRQWRLDAMQAQFGRLQAQVRAAEAALEASRAQLVQWEMDTARPLGERFDALAYRQALRWLGRMCQQMAQDEGALESLRSERAELSGRCLALQRQIEALAAHRADCQAAFVVQESSHLATEADRAWMARSASFQPQFSFWEREHGVADSA